MTATAWATELEECSRQLLFALQRRSPDYVEFLERRARLLSIRPSTPTAQDAARVSAALTRARMIGAVCIVETRRMRSETTLALEASRQEELLASGLRALFDPQQAMLDLKG
ncbi:MAG: hypothetical protein HY821_23950 [Acidobacteria bacterium]|nr:hypothetical protein [Acidobacteriota bacterium]